MITTANKIIADSGHECMVSLLESVKSIKTLPKILDEMSSKNQQVRMRISSYVSLTIEHFGPKNIEKVHAMIESCINLSVSDANPKVRENGRRSFHLYQERFPEKADKLFQKFSPAVQKALEVSGVEPSEPKKVVDVKRNNYFSGKGSSDGEEENEIKSKKSPDTKKTNAKEKMESEGPKFASKRVEKEEESPPPQKKPSNRGKKLKKSRASSPSVINQVQMSPSSPPRATKKSATTKSTVSSNTKFIFKKILALNRPKIRLQCGSRGKEIENLNSVLFLFE
jgi:hypothetical protein